MLKRRLIDLTFKKSMSFEILNIHKAAPEILDFSKVSLADFEFDTPGLWSSGSLRGLATNLALGNNSQAPGALSHFKLDNNELMIVPDKNKTLSHIL